MRRTVITAFFALLICLSAARADTTWVSQGDVRGHWTAAGNPYMINGHLQLIGRDTLVIEQGVRVFFNGPYRMYVYGVLDVRGTEDEEVLFTTDTLVSPEAWGGIRFLLTHGVSRLSHAVIELGRATGQEDYGLGGAMFLDSARVELHDCTIRQCVAGSGHAIFARDGSQLVLDRCLFIENGREYGSGGAICLRPRCYLTATDCSFISNIALYGGALTLDQAEATFTGCRFEKNVASISGGVMFGSDATLVFRGCTFAYNESIDGGAMDARNGVRLTMDHCLLAHNRADHNGAMGRGGALLLQSGRTDVTQCTFAGNYASVGAAIHGGSSLTVRNCIIARQEQGGGMYFAMQGAVIRNTCFGSNTGGDFVGPQPPHNLGQLIRVNANGDSCDIYFNIMQDPQFDDSSSLVYDLTVGSPCIDAGDPALPHDPDGTVADMGAFYFAQTSGVEDLAVALPDDAALHPAYPNPFNPGTTLAFDLERAGFASLRIYDLLGRETAVLIESSLQPGSYIIAWNAAGSPTGTYLAVLEFAGQRHVQKLLLLK